MSNNDESYSNKLKEKITTQAKRLTLLEIEKEELLDLLKEKNISFESSLSSCFLSNGKLSSKGYPSKSKLYESELEKYKKELQRAKDKITELQQSKDDMLTFKEQITERLTHTTIDIEKSKKNINELQAERDELSFKVSELETTNRLITKALREKDSLLISLENSIKGLKEEKAELASQVKRYEASNIQLQKESCELAMMLSEYDKQRSEYYNAVNESNELKQSMIRNDKENRLLTDRLRVTIDDNKRLSQQLMKSRNDNCSLNKEITELKLSNGAFSQTINALTDKLDKFQVKVANDINKTLKISTNIEVEQKTKEYLNIIDNKDNEIVKLKELIKNYLLLEREMSKSFKEKDDLNNRLKGKCDSLTMSYKKLQTEARDYNEKIRVMTVENEDIMKENEKYKAGYENMNNQYQNTVKMKNMQINNLKAFSELLEEKIISQEKNKNYYEHLLLKTHPNSTIVREILELYAEIVELENEKKEFDQEISCKGTNETEGSCEEREMNKQRILNIEKQIDCLKDNLKNLEKEIYIKNTNYCA